MVSKKRTSSAIGHILVRRAFDDFRRPRSSSRFRLRGLIDKAAHASAVVIAKRSDPLGTPFSNAAMSVAAFGLTSCLVLGDASSSC